MTLFRCPKCGRAVRATEAGDCSGGERAPHAETPMVALAREIAPRPRPRRCCLGKRRGF